MVDGESSIGKKWRETKLARPHPKRLKIYRWEDMVSTEVSNLDMQMDGFAVSVHLSEGSLQLRIVVDGDSLQIWGKAWSRCSQCDDTVEMHQLPRGSKHTQQAGGMFFAGSFDWRRMVAPSGFDWRPMVVVASSGVDWLRRMDTSGTK